MLILTPDTPGFWETLATPPPGWINAKPMDLEVALVADAESGILRPASPSEFWDYVYGGEYEERLEKNGSD